MSSNKDSFDHIEYKRKTFTLTIIRSRKKFINEWGTKEYARIAYNREDDDYDDIFSIRSWEEFKQLHDIICDGYDKEVTLRNYLREKPKKLLTRFEDLDYVELERD
jgi:hypothetical protein